MWSIDATLLKVDPQTRGSNSTPLADNRRQVLVPMITRGTRPATGANGELAGLLAGDGPSEILRRFCIGEAIGSEVGHNVGEDSYPPLQQPNPTRAAPKRAPVPKTRSSKDNCCLNFTTGDGSHKSLDPQLNQPETPNA